MQVDSQHYSIPLVAAFSVFFYLHRRNVKRLAAEEAHDPHKSLDFGLDDNMGRKRQSIMKGGEKQGGSRFNRQQMSMDMNLSSPYLLPPDAHGSQSSLNSLARTLNPQDDPFRPVTQYTASDAASVRSMPRGTDRATPSPGPRGPPPRQGSMPRSPEPTHARPGMGPNGPLSPRGGRPPRISVQDPSSAATSDNETSDSEKTLTGSPREPPAAAQKAGLKPLASPTQPVSPSDSAVDIGSKKPSHGLGLANIPEPMQASIHDASSPASTPASTPREPTHPSSVAPTIQQPQEYFDLPKMPEEHDDDDRRGRNMQRKSQFYEQQDGAQDGPGLGVPQNGENRRLSVGFRPLPPDDIMESEDPEYRANRIRSFYKEYFEDKPGDAPPVPALPKNIGQMQGKGPGPGPGPQQRQPPHIQDYDDMAAPYFDPKANAFVMPYAQPVARRAMTPPPSGQRFPGPRGPGGPGPRGPGHVQTGSMRGMPPGIGGPPRPGSSVSNQMGPPRRPGSAASAYGRPRAGSAFAGSNAGSRAGSRAGGPRKPMPPPADLPTVPAPSMLKDEFSIFNAADFAPPETFKDRVRGRSQSPAGERRPYQMKVPVHSPLANAFEELPTLPSP